MNTQQAELHQRIQALSLDDLGADLPFSKRLARENSWSAQYTQKVIEEYKKFIFLAVVAGYPVTPSDQVDRVWHLHLTYTHAYWDDFCAHVLQMPLHHFPTKGGRIEQQKYEDYYRQTLISYQAFFGAMPPEDIWPSLQDRFGRDLRWRRVNTQDYWILPKPKGMKIYIHPRVAGILAFAMALIVATTQPLLAATATNPLNFGGSEFIELYLVVLFIAGLIAFLLRQILKYFAETGDGNLNEVQLNYYEVAYLKDGVKQVITTAIVNLVDRGHLKPISQIRSLQVETPLPADSHPIEVAVANVASSGTPVPQIYSSTALKTPIEAIRQSLQRQGLIPIKGQMKWVCLLPSLFIAAVLVLGLLKIYVGISRGKPVGFLIVLCIITAFILLGFLQSPLRSRFGGRYLTSLRSRYTRNSELGFACALFGVGALSGAAFTDLRQVLSSAVVSGEVGDGGGGGCGGCGGCGGGG